MPFSWEEASLEEADLAAPPGGLVPGAPVAPEPRRGFSFEEAAGAPGKGFSFEDAQAPQGASLTQYGLEAGQAVLGGAAETAASVARGIGTLQTAFEGDQPRPVAETGGYRVGEAISGAAQRFLQPRDVLNPLVRDVAAGVGSVGVNIAPSLIPYAGIPLAIGGALTQGMGEAAERAVKAKATPRQQREAGLWGALPGATEFADVLIPKIGAVGAGASLLKKVATRAGTGFVLEGGQEAAAATAQNLIAQQVYKPDQKISEDVAYNFLVGGLVGAGVTPAIGAYGDRQQRLAPGPVDEEHIKTARAVAGMSQVAPPSADPGVPRVPAEAPSITVPTTDPQPLDMERAVTQGQTPVEQQSQTVKPVDPAVGPIDQWMEIATEEARREDEALLVQAAAGVQVPRQAPGSKLPLPAVSPNDRVTMEGVERPVSVALTSADGQVFMGDRPEEALQRAREENNQGPFTQGALTSRGRIVSLEEAAQLGVIRPPTTPQEIRQQERAQDIATRRIRILPGRHSEPIRGPELGEAGIPEIVPPYEQGGMVQKPEAISGITRTGVLHPNVPIRIQTRHAAFSGAWLDEIEKTPAGNVLSTVLRRVVSQQLKRVAGDVPVYIVTREELAKMDPEGRVPGGRYIRDIVGPRSKDKILINDELLREPALLTHSVMHEIVHAATVRGLYANPVFAAGVERLMGEARTQLDKLRHRQEMLPFIYPSRGVDADYAFTNVREFIAETMSSPNFQWLLSHMLAPRELITALELDGPRPTLWQALAQWIHKMMGWPQNLEAFSMLEASMRLGDRIIDFQARMPGDHARPDVAPNVIGYSANHRAMTTDGEDSGVPAVGYQGEFIPLGNGIGKLFGGSMPPQVAQGRAHADRMNWAYKWLAGLDQLKDSNPNHAPLIQYTGRIELAHREERDIMDAGVAIGKDWRRLGPEEHGLTAFFEELVQMSYRSQAEVDAGTVRNPTEPEFTALVAKHKLSDRGLEVYGKSTKLMTAITEMLASNAAQRVLSDPSLSPDAKNGRLDAIRAELDYVKSRPFFPFMRFGRYYAYVKDPNGNMIRWETFERYEGLRSGHVTAAGAQQAAVRRLKADFQQQYGVAATDRDVVSGVMPKSVGPLVGLPNLLLDELLASQGVQFTPEQFTSIKLLREAQKLGQVPVLAPHFQRKYHVPGHGIMVAGYSMNTRRSFARYTFHAAKYMTRVKHAPALEALVKGAELMPGNKEGRIAEYMRDHFENTFLDPRGDFGVWKGAMFVWAMGYVPAAATQNLSQIPMITYPWLAGKFGGIGVGDARAVKAVLKAMGQMKKLYREGPRGSQHTDTDMRALSYAVATGRITETQATDLAGQQQSNNLMKGIGGVWAQQKFVGFIEKSAWMFEMAEQWNRRVTFRAALMLANAHPRSAIIDEAVRLHKDEFDTLVAGSKNNKPMPIAEARSLITALHAVEKTQYNYSAGMRPRAFRGNVKGALTIFQKYMQSTLWLLAQNKSDVLPRYLLITAFIGGLGGLPFMEDLKELIRAVGQRLFGKDFNIEKEARRYIMDHFDGKIEPDLILHGMARRGMGVPALLDLMGSFATGKPGRGLDAPRHVRGEPVGFAQNVPFPTFDRSKALTLGGLPISMGKLFQETDDSSKVIAEQTQKASGALFSVGFNMYKAIMDNHLEKLDAKRWERAVPRELGAISRSWRAFDEGRERSKGGPGAGSTIVKYDRRDTEQMMEVLGMMGGYMPLRQQARWDAIMAVQEVQKYYDLQRNALLEQLFEARGTKRPEEIAEVKAAIQKFNRELPDWARGRAITADTALQSLQRRERAKQLREAGVPAQRGNVPLAREVQRLYPESTVDVRLAPGGR